MEPRGGLFRSLFGGKPDLLVAWAGTLAVFAHLLASPLVAQADGASAVTTKGVSPDYGDAPDPPYPTLDFNSGALHGLGSGVFLGACADTEFDGAPSAGADGDDLAVGGPVFGVCAVAGDDEDGVVFTSPLIQGTTADVDVTAAAACTLSAWIDFNGDGDWADAGEDLFPGGQALAAGVNSLGFAVPVGAVAGTTASRFRCTTAGAVSFTGFATDGEVEDYLVTIVAAFDFGDAPDPTYPTLAASSGASHTLGGNVFLGACVDAETDGQPSASSDGDDLAAGAPVFGVCAVAGDDDDGVVFTSPLNPGAMADVDVTAAEDCTLSAWIDFNADGDWADAGEDLFPGGQVLIAGANSLGFAVPAGAVAGSTASRFRCTEDGAVSFIGLASDGEVEDYVVTIVAAFDFGDAPDPTYPTLSASSGASHTLGGGVYLGSCVDGEADGQPSASSDGDDLAAGAPVFGACAGSDDEDGVVFTSALNPGAMAGVDVTASSSCTLSAWIDFNADGDWADAGEDLFPGGQVLAAGVNSLGFAVPAGAVAGSTASRFRCTTDGAVSFTGLASDGEVEDHPVAVAAAFDFGDAPDPTYPTLSASSGASHTLGGGVYLGACVDGEADGQPSASSDGDDLAAGAPVFGACAGSDDEDGVVFTSALDAGAMASVDVTASAPCTLSAWIDFSGDGDWAEADEDLFPGGQVLAAGVNSLGFAVPAGAASGLTSARFRCTTAGAVTFTGLAPDGEVEDYQVNVVVLAPTPATEIPTLGLWGILALAAVLTLSGLWALRRIRWASRH